jgi:hypothetical protein
LAHSFEDWLAVACLSRHAPDDLANGIGQHNATERMKCLQNHHSHIPPAEMIDEIANESEWIRWQGWGVSSTLKGFGMSGLCSIHS